MRLNRFAAGLLALLFVASCRTAGPVPEFLASTPAEAWQQLVSMRSSVAMQSYARLRVTEAGRTRSFNARIAATTERFSINVLTPVGTAAATIYGDANDVVVADHIHNTTWRGDVRSLLGSGLRELDARSLVLLAFGLPVNADGSTSCGDACRSQNGIDYSISTRGLTEARSGDALVRYLDSGVPPRSATLTVGGRETLFVEHRNVEALNEAITPPDTSGYRIVSAPAVAE